MKQVYFSINVCEISLSPAAVAIVGSQAFSFSATFLETKAEAGFYLFEVALFFSL